MDDEIALAKRAKTDNAAFTILYERYMPRIFAYVMKRVGNREETEDIVSQTFLKVTESFSSFEIEKGSFKSWLYAIATNVMIDYFRASPRNAGRRYEPIEEHLSQPAQQSEATPREDLLRAADRTCVFAAIVRLSGKYQRILYMKYYSDLRHEEIAAAMGISVNNVAVLLHRALKKFHKMYCSLNP